MKNFMGLALTGFTPLNNNLPHCLRNINNPFHQKLRKVIAKYLSQIGDSNPYVDILPKPTKPLYMKLKIMYRYTVVDVKPALKALYESKTTNRTREVTYRLLFNMSRISDKTKCPSCNDSFTEVHLYG